VAARKVGANKIATAHTLDDEAQTILMNIFRGDLARLAKEKPVTDAVHPKLMQKIKPFCQIPEKESALYAYIKKVKFQASPCPYASEACGTIFVQCSIAWRKSMLGPCSRFSTHWIVCDQPERSHENSHL
jgi:hypothetical protein